MNIPNNFIKPVKVPLLSLILLLLEYALKESFDTGSHEEQTTVFWKEVALSIRGLASYFPQFKVFFPEGSQRTTDMLRWAFSHKSEDEIKNYGKDFITSLFDTASYS